MTPQPSESFIDLLGGNSPEAMYDALHAGRCLSATAIGQPDQVIGVIKSLLLTIRQRALAPPNKLKRVAQALAEAGYLSEDGMALYLSD